MNLPKLLGFFWVGMTIASVLDLAHQFLLTESVNYVNIGGFWLAMTFVIGVLVLMFLEDKEKQNRKSKLSELEERIETLEEKVQEVE